MISVERNGLVEVAKAGFVQHPFEAGRKKRPGKLVAMALSLSERFKETVMMPSANSMSSLGVSWVCF